MEDAKKIITYFDGRYAGSINLVLAEMLDVELINDIDIIISKSNHDGAYQYLLDIGYATVEKGGEQIGYDNKKHCPVWDIIRSNIFTKKGKIPIHLLIRGDCFRIMKNEEIIHEKLLRCNRSDILQLKNYFYKKIHLCDLCCYHFADCKKDIIIFGTGNGNDNVVECDGFEKKKVAE